MKDYGSTMGGQMTAGAIRSLAAALAGVGAGLILKWYWGVAVFAGIYALSFAIRAVVESSLARAQGGGYPESTEPEPGARADKPRR
ncbi:MAG: hypothetical protein ABII00_01095 [Elusimicrobiota bacterium]